MLVPLSTAREWELVDGSQDVRGWPVRDHRGEVARVVEMIIDTDRERVDELILDNGSRVAPAEVDLEDGTVLLRPGARLRDVWGRVTVSGGSDTVRVPVFQEELVAQAVPREVGEVEITRRVVEEERSVDVPVTRQRVQVRRVRVDRPAEGSERPYWKAGELHIPRVEERLEIRRVTRVVEELVVSRSEVRVTERVRETLRREEIDVNQRSTSPQPGQQRQPAQPPRATQRPQPQPAPAAPLPPPAGARPAPGPSPRGPRMGTSGADDETRPIRTQER